MSHSPPDEYATLVEELGEIQSLSASIARRTNCKEVSRVFSHVCNLIWKHAKDSPQSLRYAASRCSEYLSRFTPETLTEPDSPLAEDIRRVYQRVQELGYSEHTQ